MTRVMGKLELCILLSCFSTALAASTPKQVVAKLTSNVKYVVNDAVVDGDRTLVLGYMQGDTTRGKELFVGSVSLSGELEHNKYLGGSSEDDELYRGVISSGYLYAVGSTVGLVLTNAQELNREGNRTVVLQIPLTSLNPVATYAGPIEDERMHTIAHTSRGTFIAGSRFGTHGGMVIKKLTRRLEYDWEIVVGSPEGSASHIAADDDGDIFLVGTDVNGIGDGAYVNFRKFYDATQGAVADVKLTARLTNLGVDGLALDYNNFPLVLVSDQFSSEMIKLNRNGLIIWRKLLNNLSRDLEFGRSGEYFTLRPEEAQSTITAYSSSGDPVDVGLEPVPAADALTMDREGNVVLTFRRESSTLTGVDLTWNMVADRASFPPAMGGTHKAVLCELILDRINGLSSVALSYVGDVIADFLRVRRAHVFLHPGPNNLLQVRIALAPERASEAVDKLKSVRENLGDLFAYHDVGPVALKGELQIVEGDQSDSRWQDSALHNDGATAILAARLLIGLMAVAALVLATLIGRRVLNRRNKNKNVHEWLEQTRTLNPARDDRHELASDLSSVHSDDIEASAVE